jgi:two-component system, LuxR family, sensor kinase FixL
VIWERRNRTPVLLVSIALVLAIAVADWWTKPYVSLGFLYLFPIMLAAGFLPRWAIALFGVVCAVLTEVFSSLDASGAFIRLVFETLALAGCGLFVAELVSNRRLTLEAQDRLRILVETSPTAIVTIDERGFIELANRAAVELLAPRDDHLIGHPIAAFLPELHHALRREEGPQFRASMQCRGHSDNGESFIADVWFSTYKEGPRPKLAAIIGEVGGEPSSNAAHPADGEVRISLTAREAEVLRFLV